MNDRRTMLGELNWIFTAVTDTIAWNSLPRGRSIWQYLLLSTDWLIDRPIEWLINRMIDWLIDWMIDWLVDYYCYRGWCLLSSQIADLFHRLFRQDLLVASLFRNFLLAERVMRSYKCSPISFPNIPHSTAQHPMWCVRLMFINVKIIFWKFFKTFFKIFQNFSQIFLKTFSKLFSIFFSFVTLGTRGISRWMRACASCRPSWKAPNTSTRHSSPNSSLPFKSGWRMAVKSGLHRSNFPSFYRCESDFGLMWLKRRGCFCCMHFLILR